MSEPQRSSPSCADQGRRAVLKVAVSVGLLLPADRVAAQSDDPRKARPRANDRFVFARGDRGDSRIRARRGWRTQRCARIRDAPCRCGRLKRKRSSARVTPPNSSRRTAPASSMGRRLGGSRCCRCAFELIQPSGAWSRSICHTTSASPERRCSVRCRRHDEAGDRTLRS